MIKFTVVSLFLFFSQFLFAQNYAGQSHIKMVIETIDGKTERSEGMVDIEATITVDTPWINLAYRFKECRFASITYKIDSARNKAFISSHACNDDEFYGQNKSAKTKCTTINDVSTCTLRADWNYDTINRFQHRDTLVFDKLLTKITRKGGETILTDIVDFKMLKSTMDWFEELTLARTIFSD